MASKVIYSDVDVEETQVDGDIKKDTEFNAIKNSLMNIINTMKGSRRMLPEFATDLCNLLFEPIDEITARAIGEEIIESIEQWEDRVEILEILVKPDYSNNKYDCRLNVRILTTNEVENIDFLLN